MFFDKISKNFTFLLIIDLNIEVLRIRIKVERNIGRNLVRNNASLSFQLR
jgi:hypothetical protein